MSDEIAWSGRMGAHLEASRKRAGLRRPELAGRLGVSEETIRLWERGAVQPSAERLARLIAVLSLEAAEWPSPASGEVHELPPLARRLRAERDGRGITQLEAAEALDVQQGTYAAWETGRSTPSMLSFPGIARFLEVPESEVAELCASPFVVDTSTWPPFGRLVGAGRQALRLTREALADAVGVSQSTVVAWELGYRMPAAPQVTRLAEVLALQPAVLAAALPPRHACTGLGELIQRRERELGLRSLDVARLTGTTEATVSRWVNGKSRPGRKNLKRLAQALEVPVEQVVEAAQQAA